LTGSDQALCNSFFRLDYIIKKYRSIDWHVDMVAIVNASRNIINKIYTQPVENIDVNVFKAK
jgi:hypothetical protein